MSLKRQERIPKYEALSYVWGVERSPDPVMIKSQSLKRSFLNVTQNLATALVYLRHRTERRVLWIDALCINQEDMEERSSQVARMAEIYRLAHRVVLWLGPESEGDGGTEALSTLRFISSQIEVDWGREEMRATDQANPSWADAHVLLPLDPNVLGPVFMLLNRPWFDRVWVQQEITVATDIAMLVCGHNSITRRQFTNAVYCLRYKSGWFEGDHSLVLYDRLGLVFEMAVSIYKSKVKQYADTLREQARTLKCSDPRDRIFAVMSTSSSTERGGNIEVDYSMTTEQVYRHFTIKQLLHTNRLDLLSACEVTEVESDHDGWPNPMPSWVPDWRRPLATNRFYTLSASGSSTAAAQFDYKQETLTLTGVKCATVTQVQPTSIRPVWEGYSSFESADSIRRSIQFWGHPGKYVTGRDAHDAYVRTLCGDIFSHHYNPPSSNFLDYEICSSILNRLLQNRLVEEDDKIISDAYNVKFVNRITAVSHGRSCFTTSEGYIGLAPLETKAGDIICVLLGCHVPMILRPNEEGRFSIVGECYCHGIMDGAVLLGPLPEGFEFVKIFQQRWGAHYKAYIDRRNGKVQIEDPRLTGHPLPPRWRIDRFEDEGASIVNFVEENDDGTEKTRTVDFDPRMTSEELRKRGVDIVRFDLI
jgi:hypothetical protein